MEPLFTNKCTYTKDAYRESIMGYYSRQRVVAIIVSCILILAITVETILVFDLEMLLLALFLLAMNVFFYAILPSISANTSHKRSLELYHEDLIATTEFFDDHFVSKAYPSNATITVQYEQVKRVLATKQLYLLVVRYNLFYLMNKNGFDKINMLEFESFLREKAPKAKFRL